MLISSCPSVSMSTHNNLNSLNRSQLCVGYSWAFFSFS